MCYTVTMTNKILLIDDLRDFRQLQDNAEYVIARNSQQALEILASGVAFAEIWFDHDLGEIDGKVDSTMVVVDFLSERAYNDEPYPVEQVLVHTSNPVGRSQIVASLTRYGYNTRIVNAPDYFIVND